MKHDLIWLHVQYTSLLNSLVVAVGQTQTQTKDGYHHLEREGGLQVKPNQYSAQQKQFELTLSLNADVSSVLC